MLSWDARRLSVTESRRPSPKCSRAANWRPWRSAASATDSRPAVLRALAHVRRRVSANSPYDQAVVYLRPFAKRAVESALGKSPPATAAPMVGLSV